MMDAKRQLGAILVAAALSASSVARAALPPDDFTPSLRPTNAVSVALEVRPGNNMCLVKGELGGRPCTLLFDTGASHTTLDAAFVRSALPGTALVPVLLGGVTNVKNAPHCFKADRLAVGAAEFGGFTVMTLDLSHLERSVGVPVHGILGMNLMGSVKTEVSLCGRRVTFCPEGDDGYGRAVSTVQPLGAMLPVEHEGKRFPLLVDSGSSFTFIDPQFWRAQAGGPASVRMTDINGSAGGAAPSAGVPGAIDIGGVPVAVKPLLDGGHGNLLGADALLECDLLIDYPRFRFRRRPRPQKE